MNGIRKIIKAVKTIVVTVFLIVGITFAVVVPNIINSKKDVCTKEVSAVVVDLRANGDGLYSPVYEAYVEGEIRTYTSNTYSNVYPSIGTEKTILINPDNDKDFYVPGGAGEMLAKIFRIIGGVFIGIALIVLIFVRVKKFQYTPPQSGMFV